jgi:putative sporulation protein YtxC
MPSFRVDYMKDIHGLASYLNKRFDGKASDPVNVKVCHDDSGLTILMNRYVRKNGRKYCHVITQIADMLADYILKVYEKDILDRIIHKICSGLPKSDTDEICRIACKRLYGKSEDKSVNPTDVRRQMISAKIAEYLKNSENLTLDGFVTFRLGEYVKRLETEVERAIRQYFVERQYEEYINLLVAFVKMQSPRVPELHVFVLPDGTYLVEGSGPFEIPEDITDSFGMDKGKSVIRDDDFMIGFLLTLAPVRIFIHNADKFRNRELLNTIRIVFSDCILLGE